MQRIFISLIVAILGVLPVAASAKTIQVVASFTLLADIVRQVGGNYVQVDSLVPFDGDPHTFEPSPADAKRLAKADAVFVSGLGLEGWMDRLIQSTHHKGQVVTLSQNIKTRTLNEDGHIVTDPHVWTAPNNGIVFAQNVVKTLSTIAPEQAATFKKNGELYIAKLKAIDQDARQKFAAIPAEKRKVLTGHDAFGYFAAAYNIQFLAPVGYSTESEASAQSVAKLIEQIRREKVKAYFLENSNNPRLVQQIAAATGAKPGGVLFVESLSAPTGPAPTYEAMLKHNVRTLLDGMSR